MPTWENPTMNQWYTKEGRGKRNVFHFPIYEEPIIFKLSTVLVKDVILHQLLTETPKSLLTLSVVQTRNLLSYLNFISFQHFKNVFFWRFISNFKWFNYGLITFYFHSKMVNWLHMHTQTPVLLSVHLSHTIPCRYGRLVSKLLTSSAVWNRSAHPVLFIVSLLKTPTMKTVHFLLWYGDRMNTSAW